MPLIVLLGQACGGDEYEYDDGGDYDPPTAAELDQWAQETLDEGSHAEARAWLSVSNNATFEASKDEVKRFVSALYRAGARKVYITGIEELGGSHLSASLLVELPASSTARAAIFAEEANFMDEVVGGWPALRRFVNNMSALTGLRIDVYTMLWLRPFTAPWAKAEAWR